MGNDVNQINRVISFVRGPSEGQADLARACPSTIVEGLAAPGLLTFMEVHSGLSARIAAGAGFHALWASSLSISSMMGLRDSNEVSWSQMLSVVEWILEASDRPVLVDGDSGHGDFNNARRFARLLQGRGAGGVCFEDKLFPKRNSFIDSGQELMDARTFSGVLAACRDTVGSSSFAIVARTEALIAGRSISEAIDRAHTYMAAGADAILVHSKASDPRQVLEFARLWDRAGPLIVVATTYPSVDQTTLIEVGVSGVIWANQNIRASILAMRRLCENVFSGRPMVEFESELASISDIFELFDYEELASAEIQYLGAMR
jgi:phosphoenolpyruvate phosphomutase